jgi:hypothetical protein
MTPKEFGYKTLTKSEDTDEVGSIMAYRFSEKRTLQAVIWDAHRKRWAYAPAIGTIYINDYMWWDRTAEVDRATAERIARQIGIELPNEETLDEMCAEGVRMGWEMGPPEEDHEDD